MYIAMWEIKNPVAYFQYNIIPIDLVTIKSLIKYELQDKRSNRVKEEDT